MRDKIKYDFLRAEIERITSIAYKHWQAHYRKCEYMLLGNVGFCPTCTQLSLAADEEFKRLWNEAGYEPIEQVINSITKASTAPLDKTAPIAQT